jgi:glutamate-1-semialdehyde 2,1-aminomutase
LVLFEGHYHGWSDAVFNRCHADLSELPEGDYGAAIPGAGGLSSALEDVIVVRWNDLDALEHVLREHGSSVAAVMMEPVMGNAGVIAPNPGFLLGARELTRQHGALLIFDEVITGMRVAAGGAQERFDVRPDITVLAKALGGGYPVAAFGASEEIMRPIVEGRMFHGGVYSGNATVLEEVLWFRAVMYRALYEVADELVSGLRAIMEGLRVPHVVTNVGPMISLFLTDGSTDRITEYRDVRRHGDFARYIEFQHEAQRLGVYFHPNMLEPMYLSTAHTLGDVGTVLERLDAAARRCFAT